MRDYIKPFIEDESIEIEDICTISSPTESYDIVDDNPDSEDL